VAARQAAMLERFTAHHLGLASVTL